jgi:tRNA A-37 threonylcarbamoyl transferase component Bud32
MSTFHLHFNPNADPLSIKDRILEIFSGKLNGLTKIESSNYTRVYYFEDTVRGDASGYYYKEYLFRNIRDRLSVLFRKSRGMRAWLGAQILLNHGLSTAVPVCVGEKSFWGITHRSFLVTEAIQNALDMEQYIKKIMTSISAPDWILQKRRFVTLLGKTIGKMHRMGIFQGDLRERNILVQEGDPPTIHLIDNERTRIYRKVPDRKRFKNLVQINMTLSPEISRADRVRFFYAYLEENPDLQLERKEWMQKILHRTRKRHNIKGRLER